LNGVRCYGCRDGIPGDWNRHRRCCRHGNWLNGVRGHGYRDGIPGDWNRHRCCRHGNWLGRNRHHRHRLYWGRIWCRGKSCWFKRLCRSIQKDKHAHHRYGQKRPHGFICHISFSLVMDVWSPSQCCVQRFNPSYDAGRSFDMGYNPLWVSPGTCRGKQHNCGQRGFAWKASTYDFCFHFQHSIRQLFIQVHDSGKSLRSHPIQCNVSQTSAVSRGV
jgi:hypothetical protein